jgi:formamidopyrimidine-DNA glycosylase
MGGRIVSTNQDGAVVEGGDSTHGLAGAHRPEWDRLSLRFDDGTALHLVDKRRLGRAVLDPDLSTLGPDALLISQDEFAAQVLRSRAPIKARLMNQHVVAGVGNLIADQLLWRALINPIRPAETLAPSDVRRLFRCMRQTLTYAIEHGGSHTGSLIAHRHAGGRCPRCHAPLVYTRVGGRSTWFCNREQPL